MDDNGQELDDLDISANLAKQAKRDKSVEKLKKVKSNMSGIKRESPQPF